MKQGGRHRSRMTPLGSGSKRWPRSCGRCNQLHSKMVLTMSRAKQVRGSRAEGKVLRPAPNLTSLSTRSCNHIRSMLRR
jgi:hypothetical protein